MATTEQRSGFRLPWSSEGRDQTDPPAGDAPTDEASLVDEPPVAPAPEPAPGAESMPPAGRRPNKFMAELTKAMQAAAEAAREETLNRFATDAKSFVEGIRERSSGAANDLRRRADDDVAAIRERSKADIARIREETDRRIAERKTQLEGEIERHAARVDREAARVERRVATFEAEMARFFERLKAEEDPTRIATLAETLPEPPALVEPDLDDDDDDDDAAYASSAGHAETNGVLPPDPAPGPAAVAEVPVEAVGASPVGSADPSQADGTDAADAGTATPEPPADTEADDPRLAALALSAEGAAEAEAAAMAAADPGSDDEFASIDDAAVAARLESLIAESRVPAAPRGDSTRTQLVVVGLISVASIASFKRHLGRITGVEGVGVSSGPDGEFVFTVNHAPDVDLRDSVPSIPGFQARVTGAAEGIVHVTAHDPDAE